MNLISKSVELIGEGLIAISSRIKALEANQELLRQTIALQDLRIELLQNQVDTLYEICSLGHQPHTDTNKKIS